MAEAKMFLIHIDTDNST